MVNMKDLERENEFFCSAEYVDLLGQYVSIFLDKHIFAKLAPIHLEYEKKYEGFNLMGRKNYFGYLLGPGKKIGDRGTYLDVKGLGWKKNDRCIFEKELGKKVSEMIGIKRDIEGARQHAIEQLALVRSGNAPIYTVTLRQQLSKSLKSYGVSTKRNKTTGELETKAVAVGPAIHIARKRAKRTGELIGAGDIMSWVICNVDHQKKASHPALNRTKTKNNTKPNSGMKAVEPMEAIEKGYQYDAEFYFERCLKMMWTIFRGPDKEPWVDHPKSATGKNFAESLRTGTARKFMDHPLIAAAKRVGPPPVNTDSPMFKFLAPTREKCANSACRRLVSTGAKIPLCDLCIDNADAIVQQERDYFQKWKDARDIIYDTCFKCLRTDDITDVNMCSNMSCPNFPTRTEISQKMIPIGTNCKRLGITIPDW